jgi:hypothetical protein
MNEQIREGFIVEAAAVEMRDEPIEPPRPRETWPVTVKLHKPIIGNKGEMISELAFREPTGGDIMRQGNPVRIDSAGEIQIDERKMTAMMGQLSGVLVPLLDAMHPRDWTSCAYRLRVFFLPDPTSW